MSGPPANTPLIDTPRPTENDACSPEAPVHLGRLAGLGGEASKNVRRVGRASPGGQQKVAADSYYAQYHGHPTADLATIVESLRGQGKSLVFLAGDSSLDNKYWLHQRHDAINGYEHVLSPPTMKADVTYWLNRAAEERTGDSSVNPRTTFVNLFF